MRYTRSILQSCSFCQAWTCYLVQIGKLTGIVSRFQLRPWRLLQLLPEAQQEDPLSITKVIAGSPVVDWTRGKAWRGEPLSVKVIGVRAHGLRIARAGHLQVLLHHRGVCVPTHRADRVVINGARACKPVRVNA